MIAQIAGGIDAHPASEVEAKVEEAVKAEAMATVPFGRREILICSALAAATIAVYWSVLGADFVRFDDPRYVAQNPIVRGGLTLEGAGLALTAVTKSNWHPLTLYSHMLDVELFGLRAGGHHAVSLLLHVINSLLLFVVLRSATGTNGRSAVVAALFALHPTHVESVAWISERKDVLSSFFGLLCIGAYLRHARGDAGRWLATSAVLLTLGLLAKPMLVTLPILLLLLDFWPLERLRRRGDLLVLLREKIPLFAISLLIGVVTLLAQQSGGALRSNVDIPLLARFANAIGSYGLYVANTLWPTALSVLYPHPNLPGGVPWDPWLVAGIAGGLVAASILFLRLGGFAATGWLWFVVGLAPVIGLLQAGEQGMADRYLYLPGIGLYLLAVWGGHALLARRFDTSTVRSLGAAIALVALAACSILTARQAACWRDSITLFTHSLLVAPGSYTLHNNLGNALHDQALFEEAIEQYRLSLSIHAGYVPAHLNLARTLEARGESAAAAEHFLRGRGVDPLSARGQLVLGGALFRDGDLAGAEAHFERARELDPQWHSPHLTLGRELLNRRETGRALTHLKEAVRLEPESASAAISMAATLQASGDLEGAISEYARATRLDPSSAAAHTGLALALAATGDSQRAAESAARARELEPDSREIDTLLEAQSL